MPGARPRKGMRKRKVYVDEYDTILKSNNIEYIRNGNIIMFEYNGRKGVRNISTTSIESFKRDINKLINGEISTTCNVCFSDCLKCSKVTCTKCSNTHCGMCYAKIFKDNDGLIVCPFCRDTYGFEMNSIMLTNGLKHILANSVCQKHLVDAISLVT